MAAGEGFKTFSTGDILTAADVNGYLMQGVWVFANATERSTEVTSPQEGNVSYLKDTNVFEIYDGTNWIGYGSGDITAVTAGSGLSGGGTSGAVTVSLDLTSANVFTAAQTATSFIVTGSTIPTNGIYRPSANTLGFSTNTTLRAILNSSGVFVIGTDTAYAVTAGFTPNLQNHGTTAAGSGSSQSRWSNDGNGPTVGMFKSRGTTIGTQTIVASGDILGNLSFFGSDGTAGITAAQIRGVVDGTPGTNDMPGALQFFTTPDGSSTLTQRMTIGSSGKIGIAGSPNAGASVFIGGNISGAVTSYAIYAQATVASTVTTGAQIFNTFIGTENAIFTLPDIVHYRASQATFGASSTVTNQYGFQVSSGLTGATNNFAFHSNIAAGTNRWGFYAQGTAANYFAGRTGVGGAATSATQFYVNNAQSASDVTVLTRNFASQTADSWSIQNSAASLIFGVTAAGWMKYISGNTATTVGAAGGASALPANPTGYLKIDIGGTEYKVPYYAA